MKKIHSIFLAATFLVTACTSAGTLDSGDSTHMGKQTPEPAATEVIKSRLGVEEEALKNLTIEVWYPWFGVEAGFFETLVREFNKTNEWGIQVNPTGQINFSNLYENVTASIPTPNRPNLVVALPEHALGWSEDQVITDLTPYVQDPRYGIDTSDIPLEFWNQDVFNGKRLALPAQRTARFMLWNQTWAGELGFGSPPDNSGAFHQQACRAHQVMLSDQAPENDAMGGWIVDTESMTAYSWLLAFQGGVLEGSNYRFLTPKNLSAFKFVKSLAEESCAWQIAADGDPYRAFATRQALFVTASLADLPAQARAFAQAGNSDKWTVIPFPGDDVLTIYGSSYVILKSSNAKQLAAWLFIRWLTDPQQDARWVETTHLFPVRTSTLDLLAAYQASHPQWVAAYKLLPNSHLQPQLSSWRTVKVVLGDGFDYIFRLDVPSGRVAMILAEMDSTVGDLAKQSNAK